MMHSNYFFPTYPGRYTRYLLQTGLGQINRGGRDSNGLPHFDNYGRLPYAFKYVAYLAITCSSKIKYRGAENKGTLWCVAPTLLALLSCILLLCLCISSSLLLFCLSMLYSWGSMFSVFILKKFGDVFSRFSICRKKLSNSVLSFNGTLKSDFYRGFAQRISVLPFTTSGVLSGFHHLHYKPKSSKSVA